MTDDPTDSWALNPDANKATCLILDCKVSRRLCRDGGYREPCVGCQRNGTRLVLVPIDLGQLEGGLREHR